MPPFRAEPIGSLLRPAKLLDLRRKHALKQIDDATLRAAEDEGIRDAVALQERVGLQLVTDGEFRRRSYHAYFFAQLGDIEPDWVPQETQTPVGTPRRAVQPVARIRSRVQWTKPIHVADLKLLQSLTKLTPKITIPGPCALHFRGGDAAALATVYKDVDAFWADTIEAFRKELAALAAAGCTYVQIDETAFAKFGDPDVQAALAARGDHWSRLIDTYIDVTNRTFAGFPTMKIGMHLCRGNRAGQFHSEGSYEEVADRLFNKLDIDTFWLEYDSPRAGDFSPLRFVPGHKHVVLGLVSTKSDVLEDANALKARIDAAANYIDLDQLAVSPQCGFASVDIGNPISPATQEAKLRRVVEVAREVWGQE